MTGATAMADFTMPALGADMENGKLVEWLVKPGARVRKGDIVAVVETHKGAIEVEIFEEGTIAELCVAPGETVPVGALLARVATGAAPTAPTAPAVAPPPVALRSSSPVAPPAPPALAIARTGRAKVTPAARRLAAGLGIDPEALHGTGVDGSVSLADVELARASGARPAASAPAPSPSRRGGFDAGEMRRAIAVAMARSKREIPHYYLSSTLDMAAALAWLANHNRDRPPEERMLAAALLLKATALGLRKHPQCNGFWRDDAFQPGEGVHVGWAISLRGGGLVAPAIHHADELALPVLWDKLRDLVARARSGGLRGSELMDATVTVTSLGERGADSVTGVIYPPQVAIVGFGRIRERPWAIDGQVVVRPLVDISLAADHRASDGHAGGLLLSTIEQLLQEPEKL